MKNKRLGTFWTLPVYKRPNTVSCSMENVNELKSTLINVKRKSDLSVIFQRFFNETTTRFEGSARQGS